jgi:hypothetical protein
VPLAGGLAFPDALPIQRKVVVGGVADPAELEADQVALSVVQALRGNPGTPAPGVQRTAVPTIRRHGAHGDHDHEDERRKKRGTEVHRCGDGCEHTTVHRCTASCNHGMSSGGGAGIINRSAEAAPIGAEGGEIDASTESLLKSNSGRGVAINGGVRSKLETVMGADLSGIRLHAGEQASQLNRGMSAVAFTHGRDIYFRDGLPNTATDSGLHLLAHELTHTVQQGSAPQISRTLQADHNVEDGQWRLAQPIGTWAGADGGIHRHSAFEHYLLGQVEPAKLASIPAVRAVKDAKGEVDQEANTTEGRAKVGLGKRNVKKKENPGGVKPEDVLHLIDQEMARLLKYRDDAEANNARLGEKGTATKNEDNTWQVPIVVLNCSDGQVVCTYSEMNTMPDLFGNPEAIEKATKASVLAILQGVRQQSYVQLGALRKELFGDDNNVLGAIWEDEDGDIHEDPSDFVGAVGPRSLKPGMLDENDVNNVTKKEGNESEEYFAALERNACHFAPESWSQWEGYHRAARHLAEAAGKAKLDAATARQGGDAKTADGLEKEAKELGNKALLRNSFGEHYLQDSFAAGHLINKTQVMQWYTQWLQENKESVGFSGNAEAQWNMAVYASGNNLKSNPQALHDKGVRKELNNFGEASEMMGFGAQSEPHVVSMMKWRALANKYKNRATLTIIEFGGLFLNGNQEEAYKQLEAIKNAGFANFKDGSAWYERKNTKDTSKFTYTLKDSILKSLGDGGAYKATAGSAAKTGLLDDAGAQTAASEFNLASYNAMMSNLYIQNATKLFHDKFCKEGLIVKSGEGVELGRIYGDDNMLNAGGQKGVAYSATTSQMSRNAIFELMNNQPVNSTIDQIKARFPNQVSVPAKGGGSEYVSVDKWNQDAVKAMGTNGFFKESMTYKSYWGFKFMGSLSSKGALDTSKLGGQGPVHQGQDF